MIPAAPSPCTVRANASCHRVWAKVQPIEATMKTSSPLMNTRRKLTISPNAASGRSDTTMAS